MWLTMSLAGKEQFFIYLQTCSTEEYEQIKKKLGEKFEEKITETDKEYLESYNKINSDNSLYRNRYRWGNNGNYLYINRHR